MLPGFIAAVSLGILVCTYFVYRDTSSRPSLFNGTFASLALLLSARLVDAQTNPDLAVGIPILVGMLLLGRAAGTFLRGRKEPELRRPAWLWFATATASLVCAAAVYQYLSQTTV
jgi:hypothetical protein